MMKHTPEAWTVKIIEPRFHELRHDMEARIEAPLKQNGEGEPGMVYNVATLRFVAMKRSPYHILRDEGVANACRIVACVNYCGMLCLTTEALEERLERHRLMIGGDL